MNLGEILTEYRRQTKDNVKPYLIDDTAATIAFNEAQREACRRARLIVDSTTQGVAQVSVSAGNPIVNISDKIISIRRARLQSRSCPLTKRLVRTMDELAPGWDTSTNTSQPSQLVVDYQTDAVYLYPTPSDDDILLMTVTRDALYDVDADDDEPEINSRYLMPCIEWMKFRCYSNEDTDLYDERKASIALSRFEAEFGPAIGATNERFEFEHYDDVGER